MKSLTPLVALLAFTVLVFADDASKRNRTALPAQVEPRPAVDFHGDPLPADAIARFGNVRLKHSSAVKVIAFAPDGQSLATAGAEGSIRIWSAATGKERLHIEGLVVALAFSPDGKQLAGARGYTRPILWNAGTGKEIRTLGDEGYRADWVVFSPDGKTLACGNARDADADRLFNVATGALIHTFPERETALTQFAFSPDGKTIASSDEEGLLFFEFVAGKVRELPRPKKQNGGLESLMFSSDGKWLVGLRDAHEVAIAEVPSGKITRTIKVAQNYFRVSSMILTPDNKTLITNTRAGGLDIWNIQTGAESRWFPGDGGPVLQMALSRDGKALATAMQNSTGPSTLILSNPATRKPILRRPEPSDAFDHVAISPDSRRVATACGVATYLWDAATGQRLWKSDFNGPLAFTPDGKTLICGDPVRGGIYILDAATGKPIKAGKIAQQTKRITGLELSRDGKLLATTGEDGFRLWDPVAGRVMHEIGERNAPPRGFAFAPDGLMIASLHEMGGVRLWDTRTGKFIRELDELSDLSSIAFSPDGQILACADSAFGAAAETTIRLWHLAANKEIKSLTGFGAGRTSLAFSPDGRTIILGAEKFRPLYLFEVASGQLRRKFDGHQGQINCLAFAPDGRYMVSGSADATMLLWDAVGARSPQKRTAPLDAAELNRLWADLAREDAQVAYQAICKLRLAPKQAVALFEQHFKPVPRLEAKPIADLLRQLDDAAFSVREKASKHLIGLGEAVEPALRQALAGSPSLELRRRVEQILDRLAPKELLRESRAFEVLENAADAESRRFLRLLADGSPNARLTTAAQAALARVDKVQPR